FWLSAHLNWLPRAQGYPFCAILTRDKIKTPATAATPKTPNILRKSFCSSASLIRSSTQRLTNSAPKTTAITATGRRNWFIQRRVPGGLLPLLHNKAALLNRRFSIGRDYVRVATVSITYRTHVPGW